MVSFSTTDLCGNATNCVNYYRYKVNLDAMFFEAIIFSGEIHYLQEYLQLNIIR